MKIQTRILLSIVSSFAVSVVFALIALAILHGMNTEFARSRIYDQIIRKTRALNILTAYLKEGSDQSDIRQVRSTLGSLDDLLSKAASRAPREETLIRQLQRNNRELGPLIDQMFATGQGVPEDIERERRNVLASQIWMRVRFISEDTDRLKDISDSRLITAQEKAGATVIALIILLALTKGVIYFLSGRSIVRGQQALQESEERFRVTLGSIGDAVISTDASGLVTFLNPVGIELTGWQLEEALGQPIQKVFKIINERTRKPAENIVERVLHEGNIVNLANHTSLITRDGREIPIEDSAAPIRDKEGGVLGVVLVFHDVTEKRRTHEALREIQRKNEFLANIIESGSQPFGVGYPDGSLGLINSAFERLTGYSSDELQAINWAIALTPPEWLPIERQKLEELHLTGKPARYEKEYIRKDGRRVPVELLVHLVADSDGVPQYYYSFLTDITERKRAEDALRESEARFRSLFENMTEGVVLHEVVYDESGTATDYRILTVNPAFEKHTGLAMEKCRGQLASILYGTGSAPYLEVYAKTANSGEPYYFETYFQPMERYFHISVSSPTRGQFVTVFEDVTERKQAEETLRTTMQRFHEILSNIFVGILVVTEDDRIEFANQNFCDLFDIAEAPSDLIGLTAKEMLQKVLPAYAEPEAYSDHIQQILSLGQRIEDEEVLMRNGRVLLRDYVPILVDGKPRGRMWQHRDITERKRAEEELRKAHDELELRVRERTAELVGANEDLRKQAALLDLSHDAIFAVDSADVVSFWSKGAEDLYGFTREQAIGNAACEFLQTRFPESLEHVVSQVIDKGQWAGELRQTTSLGKELVVESRWALRLGEDGKPAGFLEVNRDITSRKIVEERLWKADRAYRTLSECNQAVIRQAEESELLHHICRIVVEVGGYRMAWVGFAEHDEKKTVRPVAHDGYDDGYLDKARITWADEERGMGPTGTAIRTGETCVSKNASQNPLFEPWRMDAYQRGFASSIALPLAVEGKTTGALTIYAPEPDAFDEREVRFLKSLSENLAYGIASMRSTIERRRSEEALKVYTARLELVNAELQEFAFVAAHDLQEPLRKIHTFCDMTVKRCAPVLDSTSKDYLDRVIKSASRMRQLLSDLLQFSQVATKPEPSEKIDLVKIVREAVDVFEDTVKNTGALVDIENMPSIEADESQMLRLFQNLISNALKFHGGETPRIKVYGKLDRKGICEIFVKDNGIGFDPKFAERIFKPFQRLHGRGEYDGTGMGLSICRKIVERHGGTIRAESEPGKGSTFIIRLPVKQGRWEGM
jgi:PAS domain S-box-containing protein